MMVDASRVNLFTSLEEFTFYSTFLAQSFQQPSCPFMRFAAPDKSGVCVYSLNLPMIVSRTLLRLVAVECSVYQQAQAYLHALLS